MLNQMRSVEDTQTATTTSTIQMDRDALAKTNQQSLDVDMEDQNGHIQIDMTREKE